MSVAVFLPILPVSYRSRSKNCTQNLSLALLDYAESRSVRIDSAAKTFVNWLKHIAIKIPVNPVRKKSRIL